MPTVLLTSGRVPAALELARLLKKRNYRVIVADSMDVFLCRYSAAFSKTFKVTAPELDSLAYQADIIDIIAIEHVDMVIPIFEEAMYISQLRGKVPLSCEVLTDSFDKMRIVHNKLEFIDLARNIGLKVPETERLCGSIVPHRFIKTGYVVKPIFSRNGQGVFIKNPHESIPEDILTQGRTFIVQQRLHGPQFCSCSFAYHGNLLATLTYKTLFCFGTTGISFQKVDNPKVDNWIKTFVEKTQWHGFISFDFIQPGDDDVYAIECNPRMTSGIHFIDSNALFKAISQGSAVSNNGSDCKPAMVMSAMITASSFFVRSFRELKQVIKQLIQCRDVIFSWKDPIPFFYQFLCYIDFLKLSRTQKIPLKDVITFQIEYQEDNCKEG